MRALAFLIPLLLAGGAGYWLGVRDRRTAVNRAYLQAQPLLRAVRALLSDEPTSTSYRATRSVTEHELEQYELGIREL